ncbi:MAG TPA: Crp/Fnr family transcriptional regulator [Burkholderiales bacterium]|nr:Crp/Fnr family transcriptional regulator [Burkholderiales bacterium]
MGQTRRVAGDTAGLAGLWGMPAPLAAKLERASTANSARRGDLIARHRAPLPGVFALQAGTVKLSLRGPDGEERVLRIVAAPDCFGEPTALLGKPCQYDAFALTDVKFCVIPSSAIFALADQDRRFAKRLLLALSERSYGILAELTAATTQRGAQRLAGYLESLARQNGSSTTVQLPVSKTVVAALLGMKKETLSRLLHQFVADGIICVERREIAILDRSRLSAVSTSRAG